MVNYSQIENVITDSRFQELKFKQEKNKCFYNSRTDTHGALAQFIYKLAFGCTFVTSVRSFPVGKVVDYLYDKEPEM